MSWFRRSILFLLVSAGSGATLGTTLTQAQVPQVNYGNFSQNPSVQKNREQLIKELQLNPTQVEQLKIVRQKFHGQKQKHNQLLTAAREELANLMASSSPPDKIRAQRDRVKTLQLQLADLKLKRMMATKKILTNEQWAKLQQMKQQRAKNINSNS